MRIWAQLEILRGIEQALFMLRRRDDPEVELMRSILVHERTRRYLTVLDLDYLHAEFYAEGQNPFLDDA